MSDPQPRNTKRGAPVDRGVTRVSDAVLQAGGTDAHTVRLVLEPGNWEEYDPFLLMAEDWFTPGTFDDHPHRGIETVTFVLEGQLQHSDNKGGRGVLGPGDAQWMTAGKGIIHREEPHGPRVHTLQLWINLPSDRKMTEPRYQDLRHADLPVRREPGALLRVFSGVSGSVAAATRNHVPITMVDMRLDAGAKVEQDLPARHNAFLYVIEGSGRFGRDATPAKAGQVVWFSRVEADAPSNISVRADEPLRAIFWAGLPVREPVFARGPFVMNTPEEVDQAYRDFREGRF
jgi:redox-sensitive bicupin YhaK (pirin superfamily)